MSEKFDFLGAQFDADQLIQFFGMDAVLRREGNPDRGCRVVIFDQPRERPTDLANPTDRSVFLSPLNADGEVTPDNEQDQLVTFVQPPTNPPVEDKVLPLTCKPKRTAPAGVSVLWEFTVRR